MNEKFKKLKIAVANAVYRKKFLNFGNKMRFSMNKKNKLQVEVCFYEKNEKNKNVPKANEVYKIFLFDLKHKSQVLCEANFLNFYGPILTKEFTSRLKLIRIDDMLDNFFCAYCWVWYYNNNSTAYGLYPKYSIKDKVKDNVPEYIQNIEHDFNKWIKES